MTEEMYYQYLEAGKGGVEKLPTYSPGTGDKRFKEAEKEFRKEHPSKPKYKFPDGSPTRES